MLEQLKLSAPFALKVMWLCLLGMPVLWTTVSALQTAGISISDIAAWVQAFGSIISIWGAFYLGALQYKRSEADKVEARAQQKQHAKNVMHRLSQDIYFHIEWLGSALLSTGDKEGSITLDDYKIRGLDLRWQHQLAALESVDVRDLDGVQTLLLADLKTACSFAIHVCSMFEKWNGPDPHVTSLLNQYLHHKAAVKMAYTVLSPPGWEIS